MARNYILIISLLSLLLLGSCKSSRNTARTGYNKHDQHVENVRHDTGKNSVDTDMGRRIVTEARKWLGTPYRYGGNTRKGVDCSGMVVAVFRDVASLKLPRSSADQHKYCRKITRNNLEAGDLVFFKGSSKGKVSHVGIFIGDNKMIHASSRGVIISDLAEKYYTRHYYSSGRVDGITFAATGNKPGNRKNKKGKQKKPKDGKAREMEEKIVIPADGGNSQAKVPGRKPTGVTEISLDEFVKASNRKKAKADSIAAARESDATPRDTVAASRPAADEKTGSSIIVERQDSATTDSIVPPAKSPVQPKPGNDAKRQQRKPTSPVEQDDTTSVADDIRRRVANGFNNAF